MYKILGYVTVNLDSFTLYFVLWDVYYIVYGFVIILPRNRLGGGEGPKKKKKSQNQTTTKGVGGALNQFFILIYFFKLETKERQNPV